MSSVQRSKLLRPVKKGHLPMARVTWDDAWMDSDAEVTYGEAHDEPKRAVDIGGFIKKTSKCVVLASNYDPVDGFVRFVTRIPMALVQKISISTAEEVAFERNGAKSAEKAPEEA